MSGIEPVLPPPSIKSSVERDPLRTAAEQLEVNFLSEMLKSAGVGKTPDSFGGGLGEDQFSSFLRQEQAQQMVKAGGIGLAQSIYEALKERKNE